MDDRVIGNGQILDVSLVEEKHVMTMLVDNKPGVLSRIVGLFSVKNEKLAAILNLSRPISIKKIARSGTLALVREPG